MDYGNIGTEGGLSSADVPEDSKENLLSLVNGYLYVRITVMVEKFPCHIRKGIETPSS